MTKDEQIKSLENRVQDLEDKISDLEETIDILNKTIERLLKNEFKCEYVIDFDQTAFKSPLQKPSVTNDVVDFIYDIFNQALRNGKTEVIVEAGEVHKALELKQRIPTVCNAMRKVCDDKEYVSKYKVIKDTPSHKSSTYTIKYYLVED